MALAVDPVGTTSRLSGQTDFTPELPSLGRRLVASSYEALPVTAIILAVGLSFQGVLELLGLPAARLPKAYRDVLFVLAYAAIGFYFVFCWWRGQTLPMRAWRLRLIAKKNGGAVALPNAVLRFILSSAAWGTALFALLWIREHPDSVVGWICLLPVTVAVGWTVFDPRKQALYDRVAGTELVVSARHRRA